MIAKSRILLLLILLTGQAAVLASSTGDLTELSLEELMAVEVFSVSRWK